MNAFAKRKILVGQVLIQDAATQMTNAAQTHKEEMVIAIYHQVRKKSSHVARMDRFVLILQV
jgi:hypothetical protein